MLKVDKDLRNVLKNQEKCFFVFKIIASQLVAVNSHYYKEHTCHRQSMCQQTVLRFHISY